MSPINPKDYNQIFGDPERREAGEKAAATKARRQRLRDNLIRICVSRNLAPTAENIKAIAEESPETYQELLDNPRWL